MYSRKEKEDRLFQYRLTKVQGKSNNLIAVLLAFYIFGAGFLVQWVVLPKSMDTLWYLGIGGIFIILAVIYADTQAQKIINEYDQIKKDFIDNISIDESLQ